MDLLDVDAQHTLDLEYPEGTGLGVDDGEHGPLPEGIALCATGARLYELIVAINALPGMRHWRPLAPTGDRRPAA
jgi:hypothetical protein